MQCDNMTANFDERGEDERERGVETAKKRRRGGDEDEGGWVRREPL